MSRNTSTPAHSLRSRPRALGLCRCINFPNFGCRLRLGRCTSPVPSPLERDNPPPRLGRLAHPTHALQPPQNSGAKWVIWKLIIFITINKVIKYFRSLAIVSTACVALSTPAVALNLADISDKARAFIAFLGYINSMPLDKYNSAVSGSQETIDIVVTELNEVISKYHIMVVTNTIANQWGKKDFECRDPDHPFQKWAEVIMGKFYWRYPIVEKVMQHGYNCMARGTAYDALAK